MSECSVSECSVVSVVSELLCIVSVLLLVDSAFHYYCISTSTVQRHTSRPAMNNSNSGYYGQQQQQPYSYNNNSYDMNNQYQQQQPAPPHAGGGAYPAPAAPYNAATGYNSYSAPPSNAAYGHTQAPPPPQPAGYGYNQPTPPPPGSTAAYAAGGPGYAPPPPPASSHYGYATPQQQHTTPYPPAHQQPSCESVSIDEVIFLIADNTLHTHLHAQTLSCLAFPSSPPSDSSAPLHQPQYNPTAPVAHNSGPIPPIYLGARLAGDPFQSHIPLPLSLPGYDPAGDVEIIRKATKGCVWATFA